MLSIILLNRANQDERILGPFEYALLNRHLIRGGCAEDEMDIALFTAGYWRADGTEWSDVLIVPVSE